MAQKADIETLPLVPLRDNIVFPFQLAPLAAGRPRSVAALEAAVAGDGRVVLAVQKTPEADEVTLDDLNPIAVIAQVGAFRRLPAGGAHALVEGLSRVKLGSIDGTGESWQATVELIKESDTSVAATGSDSETDALAQSIKALFSDYVSAGASVGVEVSAAMARATEPARIADLAAGSTELTFLERVDLLQETGPIARLKLLLPLMAKQVEVAQLRSRINQDVHESINKNQREHILREQLRAIRKELSELEGEGTSEEDLTERIEAAGMPEAIKTKALKEISRLEQIPSASPELAIVRTYVDWLLDLPWGDPPPEHVDIEKAQEILDQDHYGLSKIKDRIIEWMAVRQRAQDKRAKASTSEASLAATDDEKSTDQEIPVHKPLQTPILCFVGPPGVGKTSLGRSIARALDRKFVRMSLGGMRDEAEIRGHRRTYIGSLPGRIIQSMKQAGTRNPVIMLDEIDKVGVDFRGDPAAALLEVLDPEQNREFSDHYLEVPYDLSHVLFITTANLTDTISPALLDRMEIIRISGYTEEEKVGIAENHLIPKQLEQHGLEKTELEIDKEALVELVRGYTREAGVRQLDRTIAQLARKIPRKLVADKLEAIQVTKDDLHEYLGATKFDFGETETEDRIGAVTGVVVSEVGGDIITVEALAIEGKSDLQLTGQLGSVMEESAKAAHTWARVHGEEFGVPTGFFDSHGIHVHVPAGAIPKDGPSAGVTMTTAIMSVAASRKVRKDVAMTGEVTLRGRVLPIGGVKDKLLAAHRAGITTFLLPQKNMRDLEEIDKEILEKINVVPVETVDQVLEHALLAGDKLVERRVGFFNPVNA